jgi:hypothetical protein
LSAGELDESMRVPSVGKLGEFEGCWRDGQAAAVGPREGDFNADVSAAAAGGGWKNLDHLKGSAMAALLGD